MTTAEEHDNQRDLLVLRTDGETVAAYAPEGATLATVRVLPAVDGRDQALRCAAREALEDALDAIADVATAYEFSKGDVVRLRYWGDARWVVKDIHGKRGPDGKWGMYAEVAAELKGGNNLGGAGGPAGSVPVGHLTLIEKGAQ